MQYKKKKILKNSNPGRMGWILGAGLMVCFALILYTVAPKKPECIVIFHENGIDIDGYGAREKEDALYIQKSGVYRISGTAMNKSIEINAPKNAEVRLIVEDLSVMNSDKPGIAVISGNVTLSPIGNDNYLSGGNEKYPAAIYAKDDLTVEGEGKISIQGTYKHGLESRDHLWIKSGNIQVTALEDGIRGKEGIAISGGKTTVEVGDDALHTDGILRISDGKLDIVNCNEGIEGHEIYISGGDIQVTASDDTLNANGDLSAFLNITGGSIWLDAQGDGIDSNGKFLMEGGSLVINGTTSMRNSPMDYDGISELQEGIIIAAGSATMPQSPRSVGNRTTLRVLFDSIQYKEQLFTVRNEAGEALLAFIPKKDYQMVVMAHPVLEKGQTIQISIGGEAENLNVGNYMENPKVQGDTYLCTVQLEEAMTSVNQLGEPCDYVANNLGW